MKAMTKSERVLATFRHQETDRVPLYDLMLNDDCIEYFTDVYATCDESGAKAQAQAVDRMLDMARGVGWGPRKPSEQLLKSSDDVAVIRDRSSILARPWIAWYFGVVDGVRGGGVMRTARVKAEGQAYYHCMSRVVDRRMILGELEREKFRELMRGAETFCGVRVLTYAILSNHFHILAEVPERQDVSEAEIRARLPAIYDRQAIFQLESQWALWRKQGLEPLVQADLNRLRARMYDVSAFVKTVKQRFSQWYNRREGRAGTLWEERFKSVMVEPPSHTAREREDVGALATLAAYIDLNAVRAGIVKDPKEYRWCGYGEAVAGRERAREGLTAVLGGNGSWRQVAASYRLLIYAAGEEQGVAEDASAAAKSGISAEKVAQVVSERGELPLQQVLRCRVRYFSDGVAIGSRAFVNDVFRLHRGNFGPKRQDGARPMRFAAWGGLCAARDLRLAPITASGG